MSDFQVIPASAPQEAQPEEAPNDLPVVGQWYWVKHERHKGYVYDEHELGDILMCCDHVGSNHATFTVEWKDYRKSATVMDAEMPKRLRPAPEWQAVLERIAMPDLPAIDFVSPTSPAGQVLASASGSLTLPPMLMAAIHANVIRFYDLCLLVRESQEEMKLLTEQYKDLASDAIDHDPVEWLFSGQDIPAMREWESAHPEWQCCGNGIRKRSKRKLQKVTLSV